MENQDWLLQTAATSLPPSVTLWQLKLPPEVPLLVATATNCARSCCLYAGLIGNELQLSLQLSVVGLIREEWLAGRVGQRQGDGKLLRRRDRRGDREDETVTIIVPAC